MKTIVMSLGGSLIAPKNIDVNFLKKFRRTILDYIKKGNRVILITGGGDTCRNYQKASTQVNSDVSHNDLDWVGIASTKLNAELVRSVFGNSAYDKILDNPDKKVDTSKKILVGAGYLPGSSSDLDAVILAKTYGAKMVINLSNITYVYDKDPSKFKDAKPQKEMTWKQMQKLVGTKWIPGAHVPFDPAATKLAARLKMKLVVAKGGDLNNLKNILAEKKFKGTIVE